MLMRIVGHFINNSQHIDKMICINGLPDDWIFRTRADGKKELQPCFVADNPDNIPKHIRHLCTPVDVVKYFPPIEKGRDGILDKMTILGVKLDYMTEAGRAMWTKIQRYVDDCLPRHSKIPEPVIVAKDQRSPFETFALHKRITGGVEMEPSEIPVVDLDSYKEKVEVHVPALAQIIVPSVKTEVSAPILKCSDCDFTHVKKQGISMHRIKRHPKERVGTTS